MAAAIPLISAGVGLIAANKSAKSVDKATATSNEQAAQVNELEIAKFEEAKRQAEILRQKGDEAAAVALEEGARAELGAEKFEALSNQYAQQFQDYASSAENAAARREEITGQYANQFQDYATRADSQSALRQKYGENIYGRTRDFADARQTAGQAARTNILQAGQNVMDEAGRNEGRLNSALNASTGYLDDAYRGTEARYQPFVDSERRAINQLDVEMGLAPGETNRTYRDSPAYSAVMDASRVAEEEGIRAIDQAAGNSGTLYSGSRGAALADRTKQGSWERAGVEQNYFQNYMGMLQQMANPASTGAVSQAQMATAGDKANLTTGTAQNVAAGYRDAANTNLGATSTAEGIGLDTMRTGVEGADLLQYMDPGTAGSPYLDAAASARINGLNPGTAGADYAAIAASTGLNGVNRGTAGSPYRLQAQDYRVNAGNNAAGVITGNMPSGVNSAGIITNAANNSAQANNAMIGDLVGAGSNIYSAYLQRQPSTVPAPQTYTSSPYMTPNMRYS